MFELHFFAHREMIQKHGFAKMQYERLLAYGSRVDVEVLAWSDPILKDKFKPFDVSWGEITQLAHQRQRK
ncbi:hypothetical protein PAAG_11181 [Paracoccidioides lutzii Pb01]|uniref:Uncharacterized protein n=1 Tax=Paracoccidioides lutzii (strain ATCC MYA-826 / Pb01) TaxID=502779 RepID=A0A0A2V6M8_PARBA|nr:hypothetical protein PAAG_11181 [Paracoccidioides lutzii Pb01]KGQ02007.1 hypothetical protein PAAG_11181 [Paracoccidioides lutzii Pb01]